MSTFEQLCHSLALEPRPGATSADLAIFEQEVGLVLPAEVRAFYTLSNGLDVELCGFRFQSLEQARSLTAHFNADELTRQHLGYFVFTESWDSNPCCGCCTGPLTGYVVRIVHDGKPRLLARTFGSFLDQLQELAAKCRVVPEVPEGEEEDSDEMEEEASYHLSDLVGDFEQPDRTPGDTAAGHALRGILQTIREGEPVRAELQAFLAVLLPG